MLIKRYVAFPLFYDSGQKILRLKRFSELFFAVLKCTTNSTVHNSQIYDEYQTQSAKVLTLLWKRAHQDDSNDSPQPISECQVDFSLLWIKAYPGLY